MTGTRIRDLLKKYLPPSLKRRLRELQRRLLRPQSTFMRIAYTTPRQVVLITTRHDGVDNIWALDWHMPLSHEPRLYAIAVNPNGYGAQLIRKSGVFVVNFVPATWKTAILYCGKVSGRTIDKFEETGLRKEQAVSVNAPRLADSLGALECKIKHTIEMGDHTFFVGEVTHMVMRADAPRLHHIDIRLRESILAGQEGSPNDGASVLD